MGAEASLLEDCVLDEPISEFESSTQQQWTVYPAVKKDGTRLTVFVHDKDTKGSEDILKNAGKHLKLLRHPGVVKYMGSVDTNESLYLLTEEVKPLHCVIDQLHPLEICAGLYNIVEVLAFLHEQGGFSHNNVCLSSIFVCSDGTWKLGGMEHLCTFARATSVYLEARKSTREASSLSPEEKAGQPELSPEYGHARDAYSFGVLCEQLLEYITTLGDLTKTFEGKIQDECLHPDPKQRPNLSSLLEDQIFLCDYVQIVNFLKNVTLQDEDDKKIFFRTLVEKLLQMPPKLVALRLVRPLLARFVLLDYTAVHFVIPHLLTPKRDNNETTYKEGQINPLLPEKLFREYVVPEIFKIFHVRDVHVRQVLLRNFNSYLHLFDRKTMESFILPQVLMGLRDTDDTLAQASLHAVADMVPILGGDIVIGTNRIKLFSEGMPKNIAANGDVKASFQFKTRQDIGNGKAPNINNLLNVKPVKVGSKLEKPTLSELAKQADREKKREENRKKREERMKRREELKKNPQKATVLERIEDTTDVQPVTQSEDFLQENQSESPKHSIQLEGSVESPNNESNWEGWAPEGDLNQQDDASVHSDEIEDEIESELSAMDSTLSDSDKSKFRRNSREKLGDGDTEVNKISGKSSGMKLTSAKKSRSSPPADKLLNDLVETTKRLNASDNNETWGATNTWNNDWSHVESKSNTESTRSSSPQNHSGRKISTRPLGSEFDIMNLDIKTGSASGDFDFFADMKPVIKSTDVVPGEAKADSLKTVSLFAAKDSWDEDTGGWGDDLNWATDDISEDQS